MTGKPGPHAEQAGYLKFIQDMNVDLTRYLVAQYQHPDRLIRIDGTGKGQLHLHDQLASGNS